VGITLDDNSFRDIVLGELGGFWRTMDEGLESLIAFVRDKHKEDRRVARVVADAA